MTPPFTLDLRKVSPETRVALRAALAAVLAVGVSHNMPWQRWYWAVMVAVLLVNGTWGENLQKASQRLGMTALGCLAAWGLDVLTHGHDREQIAVMLVAIFLAVYYRTASYPLMTFFVSVYVIFLFAIIGQRPAGVIKLRVIQTGVGIVVALVASVLVPTPVSRSKWREQLVAFWESAGKWFDLTFEQLLSPPAEGSVPPLMMSDVVRPLETLRSQQRAAFYEGMFMGVSRERSDRLMELTRMLGHDLMALSASAAAVRPEVARAFAEELGALRACTMSHFRSSVPALFDQKGAPAWDECDGRIDGIEQQLSTHAIGLVKAGTITREELVSVAPIITYTEQINRVMRALREGEGKSKIQKPKAKESPKSEILKSEKDPGRR